MGGQPEGRAALGRRPGWADLADAAWGLWQTCLPEPGLACPSAQCRPVAWPQEPQGPSLCLYTVGAQKGPTLVVGCWGQQEARVSPLVQFAFSVTNSRWSFPDGHPRASSGLGPVLCRLRWALSPLPSGALSSSPGVFQPLGTPLT